MWQPMCQSAFSCQGDIPCANANERHLQNLQRSQLRYLLADGALNIERLQVTGVYKVR